MQKLLKHLFIASIILCSAIPTHLYSNDNEYIEYECTHNECKCEQCNSEYELRSSYQSCYYSPRYEYSVYLYECGPGWVRGPQFHGGNTGYFSF